MEHRHHDMSDDPPVWGHERIVYIELCFSVAFDYYRIHSTQFQTFDNDQ